MSHVRLGMVPGGDMRHCMTCNVWRFKENRFSSCSLEENDLGMFKLTIDEHKDEYKKQWLLRYKLPRCQIQNHIVPSSRFIPCEPEDRFVPTGRQLGLVLSHNASI